jgi:hypothetical protein
MTDHLVVYYKNALKTAMLIEAAPLVTGVSPQDVYDPFLSRPLVFTSPEAAITAKWGVGNYIDSVCLADCLFTQAKITVKQQGAAVFTGWKYPQGKHSAFALPSILPCDELAVEIYGGGNISLGWMFAGLRTLFPRFQVKPKTGLEVTGSAARTETGQVHGIKRVTLKTLEAAFARVNRDERRQMEEYIDTVQYIEPHLVEAYNPEEWPLLYGVLTSAGDFPKRDEPGFYFDTSMAWKETK